MRSLRSRMVSPRMHGPNKGLSILFLWLFFLTYWFIVYQLEGIETDSPQQLQELVERYPLFDLLSPLIQFLLGMFSPRVLRHFIPVFIAWWLARRAIKLFLESFYNLPDLKAAGSLFNRLLADRASYSHLARIQSEQFDKDRQENPLFRIGGPGFIFVNKGYAVVTEINGRTQRVLGLGFRVLKRFEYPVAVVDLRPQDRWDDSVKMMTSDGIEIKMALGVTFQIDSDDQDRDQDEPYPLNEQAVREAVIAQTSLPDGQTSTWDILPLFIVRAQLRSIIAEMRLDEIIYKDDRGIRIYKHLKKQAMVNATPSLKRRGVKILNIQLGELVLPNSVTEKHIGFWRALKDKQRRILLAEAEATEIVKTEQARAEAEAIMIQAIVEGMDRAKESGKDVDFKQIAALRLLESLEMLAQQSRQVMPLPENLLLVLDDLRKELVPDDDPVSKTAS